MKAFTKRFENEKKKKQDDGYVVFTSNHDIVWILSIFSGSVCVRQSCQIAVISLRIWSSYAYDADLSL